jgi:hypothetical protein
MRGGTTLTSTSLLLILSAVLHAAPARAQDEADTPSEDVEIPVRVTGTPHDAALLVDREALGTLPFEGTLSAGLHYFVVRAHGYYDELRDVYVVPSAAPIELRFDLVLDPAMQPPRANAPMIVGGSVVTLGGVAAVVLAIVGATGDRHCSARCDELGGRHVVERPAVDAIVAWSVVGGVALVVGSLLVGFGVAAGVRSSAPVSLSADGLSVSF